MNDNKKSKKKKETPSGMNINDVRYQSKIYKGFFEKKRRPSSSTQSENKKNQDMLVDTRDTSTFIRSGFERRKDESRSNAYIHELAECCPDGFEVLVDVGLPVNTQQESEPQEKEYYQDLMQVFGYHASDNEQCSGK